MATQNNDNTADVVVRGDAHSFKQEVNVGKHHVVADEPARGLYVNDGRLIRAAKTNSARNDHGFTPALAHLRKRLRGVRNEGWHAGQNRSRIGTYRPLE